MEKNLKRFNFIVNACSRSQRLWIAKWVLSLPGAEVKDFNVKELSIDTGICLDDAKTILNTWFEDEFNFVDQWAERVVEKIEIFNGQ